MPLQNRVTPFGEIIADPARGTLMGNRGGRLHDPVTKTLNRRRWASRQWIICQLQFKARQREVMSNSYTELFFLDEVTALAAGHRPCFECRRAAANSYFAAHQSFCAQFTELPPPKKRLTAPEMDTLLHLERQMPLNERPFFTISDCPDGTMLEHDDAAWALRKGKLLRWAPGGYSQAIPARGINRLRVLTPMTTLCILQHGYEPVWHETAGLI